MNNIVVDLNQDKAVSEIISRLRQSDKGVVKADGTWGSFAPLLAAHIAAALNRPVLYISPHIDDADRISDDLHTFSQLDDTDISRLGKSAVGRSDCRRNRLPADSPCFGIVTGKSAGYQARIISTCVQALNQPVPKIEALRERGLELVVGKSINLEEITHWLFDNGFERTDSVDYPGQFAHRGGIVDIFASVSFSGTGRFGL